MDKAAYKLQATSCEISFYVLSFRFFGLIVATRASGNLARPRRAPGGEVRAADASRGGAWACRFFR